MAYTKTTDFAAKDDLLTGDPDKIIKGAEIDTEFTNIDAAFDDYSTTTQVAAGLNGSGTALTFTQSGTGASARTFAAKAREVVSVLDFGAVGDGATDDATAIQKAITYACSVLGSVFFPKTTNHGYKIGTGLSVTAPIRIFGETHAGSYLTTAADINGFSLTTAANGAVFEDIQIIGPGTGSSTKAGVTLADCPNVVFNRVYIRNWDVGVDFASGSCYDCAFRDSLIVSNGTANIRGAADTNALGVYGTQFGGGADTGISLTDSNTLTVIGGGCEGNTVAGVSVDTTSGLSVGVTISGVHFENNTSSSGDIVLGATAEVRGVVISGNLFVPGTGADCAIRATNVRGMTVMGNTQNAGYTGVSFMREGTIDGLMFQHSSATAQGGGTRIRQNYGTPVADNLTPLAQTSYDAAVGQAGNFNQYRMNSGSMAAGKNYYAGVDAIHVANSGTPSATAALYARAMIVTNSYGAAANTRAALMLGAVDGATYTMTYSASMTIPADYANDFVITATNGTAFAINAPVYTAPSITGISGVVSNQKITVTIKNSSGGALGTATWNAVFKMASWTQPADGYSRSITFRWNGTNWVEIGRTTADVPN